MGMLPLDLHIQEVGLNAYSRLYKEYDPKWDHIGTQKSLTGHLGLWRSEMEELYPKGYPREESLLRMVWIPSHTTGGGEVSLKPRINIYTDAAKAGDNVGLGWVALDGNNVVAKNYSPAKEINIHQAEMLAIKEALTWIKVSGTCSRGFTIWTDSQSSVGSLGGYQTKDTITWETLSLLRSLGTNTLIDICWVKGHSNNVGNDMADMLAKRGMEEAESLLFSRPYMPVSQRQIKQTLRHLTLDKWQQAWDMVPDCKISHLFRPIVGQKKHIVHLSFGELSKLAQIVTGHGLFKKHLRHWNVVGDIQCSLCGEDLESSWHLWDMCPRLVTERNRLRCLISKGLSEERALLKFFDQQVLIELDAHNEAIIGT